MPINASTNAIATKITAAMMLIANAFSHPQSKKCFTNARIITNIIREEMIPSKKKPKIELITVPSTTIHIASVTFAFCPPTNILPEIQSDGASTTMLTTILTISPIKVESRLTIFFSKFIAGFWLKTLP